MTEADVKKNNKTARCASEKITKPMIKFMIQQRLDMDRHKRTLQHRRDASLRDIKTKPFPENVSESIHGLQRLSSFNTASVIALTPKVIEGAGSGR